MSTVAPGRGDGTRSGGRRRWWVRPVAVAAVLVLTPLVELTVLVLLSRWAGWWPVLGVVLLACVAGALVVRRQAPRTWRQLRESMRVERLVAGRLPGPDVLDGALVLLGGVLLAVPGLVSDVLGIACLLPFVRPVLRRGLLAWVRRRATAVSRRVRPPGAGRVVRSEVVDAGGAHAGGAPAGAPHAGGAHAGGAQTPRGSTGEAGRPGDGRVIEGRVVDEAKDPRRPR